MRDNNISGKAEVETFEKPTKRGCLKSKRAWNASEVKGDEDLCVIRA